MERDGLWVQAQVLIVCVMKDMRGPMGNWLGCVIIGTGDINSSETVDPHEQSLGEYGEGHSTVTFILDKQTRKRVAWTGINWDVQEFLLDIKALSTE